jgi:UPF0176 protein
MTHTVAALYQFVSLPDFRNLREPLRDLCHSLNIQGSLLLAHEGLNGTVSGTTNEIQEFITQLKDAPLFGGRLDRLELKLSTAAVSPFRRMKVRLKKEIVTFGDTTDPLQRVGRYVAARDWNALLESPDVLLIDTRNAFEIEVGTFEGAIDPNITRFSEFRDFVHTSLDPAKHKKIAMFCTGGIRCEKASSYMLSQGFEEVYHLKGGILKYLEDIPEEQSKWRGDCFVFDQRFSLGHGLTERNSTTSSDEQCDD